MDRTSSFPSAILSDARRFTRLRRPGCCGNDITYPWSYGRHLVDADSIRPGGAPGSKLGRPPRPWRSTSGMPTILSERPSTYFSGSGVFRSSERHQDRPAVRYKAGSTSPRGVWEWGAVGQFSKTPTARPVCFRSILTVTPVLTGAICLTVPCIVPHAHAAQMCQTRVCVDGPIHAQPIVSLKDNRPESEHQVQD
jgi:hypothetical protein